MAYNESRARFEGPYKELMEEYINYKKSLGFKYTNDFTFTLNKINSFLALKFEDKIMITEQMANEFFESYLDSDNLHSKTIHVYRCAFRQFCLYLKNKGYQDIYVLPPKHNEVKYSLIPYIFSKDEIIRLFSVIDSLPEFNKYGNVQRLFYQTLFRVLYGTGIRFGEALSLKIQDVDLDKNLLIINSAKGNVSRLVPFDASLGFWLKKYRDTAVKESDVYFFESPKKGIRAQVPIRLYFLNTILPATGIPSNGKHNIRIHDLRHTFACSALNKMVQEGYDPFCALPYLSAYLGHKGIESTEKYLRLTEEHFKEIVDAGHYIYKESLGE